MDETIVGQLNFQTFILFGLVVIGLWSFISKVMDIVKHITARHDREKKWDEMAENIIKEREAIKQERNVIVNKYDEKLVELERKIDENNCDSEAKTQELKAGMYILTKSVSAVLDGLKQLNCNGQVTVAKQELDAFLMNLAYDQNE